MNDPVLTGLVWMLVNAVGALGEEVRALKGECPVGQPAQYPETPDEHLPAGVKRFITQKEVREMIELCRSGHRPSQISRRFNCSPQTVCNHLIKAGVWKKSDQKRARATFVQ